MTKPAKPRLAFGISSSRCEHGTMFVHLHDEKMEIFATASMEPELALEFLGNFGDALEAVLAEREGAPAPDGQAVH